MSHRLFSHWTGLLLIVMPLTVSLACQTLTAGPATNPQPNLALGPGPFMYEDMKAGLANLSSYKATLTYSFDGTRADRAEHWSKTYVMLATKEPAARQLTIETVGNISDIDSMFMAEADGAAYKRAGENACTASPIKEGASLGIWLEPAAFLTSVIGANEAGGETVNDMAADHYTFDERALGQVGLAKSTGEMWVASEGGYIVKYVLSTKADANYFGEGIEGTLTWDYELTDVNQLVTIELPADCPAGMLDVPQLPDATEVVDMPGLLTYTTGAPLADAATFYQEQIPGLGWTLSGEPSISDSAALLNFTREDQTMTVIIIVSDTATNVQILLGSSQK